MREQRLQEWAERYHRETETFDRTVCTGPVRGGVVLPANGRETALIGKNARDARSRILEEAHREGFTTDEIDEAIRRNA